MTLRLWHGFGEDLLEVLAAERVLSVVGDEGVEGVKRQVVYQVVLGLTPLLLRLDATVVHLTLTPGENVYSNNINLKTIKGQFAWDLNHCKQDFREIFLSLILRRQFVENYHIFTKILGQTFIYPNCRI